MNNQHALASKLQRRDEVVNSQKDSTENHISMPAGVHNDLSPPCSLSSRGPGPQARVLFSLSLSLSLSLTLSLSLVKSISLRLTCLRNRSRRKSRIVVGKTLFFKTSAGCVWVTGSIRFFRICRWSPRRRGRGWPRPPRPPPSHHSPTVQLPPFFPGCRHGLFSYSIAKTFPIR